MATHDETELSAEQIIREAQERAEQRERQKETEHKPQNATQWIGNVESALREILPPHKQQELENILARAKALQDAQQVETDPVGRQVKEFFEELDVIEVERLLKQLESLPPSGDRQPPKEVVLYRQELEEVKREAVRREVRVGSITAATRGSLEQQVFENFSKYLEEGARIVYGGDKLEVHRTADGILVIQVPEPTFENMLVIAGQLGNFKERYGNSPAEYGEDLMVAAMIMDGESIFSKSAVERFYNVGRKLKEIAEGAKQSGEYVNLDGIQADMRRRMTDMGAWQSKVDDVYKRIFLGKHEVELESEGGLLRIKKTSEGSRKLYDVLFDQWQKWLTGDPNYKGLEKAFGDSGAWLAAHGYSLAMLQDPSYKDQIIKAYDEWLCDPARKANLLKRMKGFMEQKVNPTGAESKKYELLFSKWRHMLLSSDGIKSIKESMGSLEGKSNEEKLSIITGFFQPNGQVERLNYLPSDVLKLFQQHAPDGTRNEAACIIADSYVRSILQANGFDVLTHLKGTHAKLIAINRVDGKAYYVEPSAPRDAVQEIRDEKLLGQIRERIPESERKDKQRDPIWRGKQNISIRAADGAIIADGNALLTSGFLVNMTQVAELPLPQDVQFVAAQKAADLFPDNPIAWLRMAQTAQDATKAEEYLSHAHELDTTIPLSLKEAKKLDAKIGNWNPPPLPPPGDQNVDNVTRQANIWIRAIDPAAGLEVLSESQLETLDSQMRSALQTMNPIANPDLFAATLDRRDQITNAARIAQQNARAQGSEADLITVFQLTEKQKNILRSGDREQIRSLIEEQLLIFARVLQPGKQVSPLITRQIEGRFNDMVTVLTARSSVGTGPGFNLTEVEKQIELEYLENIGKVLQGAPNVAAMTESNNPDLQKRAQDAANFMDERGGLAVLDQLFTMHDGRVGGLVSDLRREMRKGLLRNFERAGSFFILQEEYNNLPGQITERVIANALNNIGDYSRFKRTNPNDLNSALRPQAEWEQVIRQQVEMDVKFAQLIFIITGEASAIYIRGRLPDGTVDFGAGAFLNSQWQDVERYGVFTESNKKVAAAQIENAAQLHLEDRYGKEMADRIKKNEALFKFYCNLNGPDILAPVVQTWWENRAVRTLQMIQSANAYEEALAALLGEPYVRPQIVKNEGLFDIPIGGDPEFGIMLRAFLYEDSITKRQNEHTKRFEETERILNGKGTDYFPDAIFEPFAHQAGSGRNARGKFSVEGVAGDRRFIDFFGGNAAAFLDQGGIPANETAYQRALRRFHRFQDEYRPKMDAIRNQRINFIDRTNPNNPVAKPRQTNFALTNGPRSATQEIQVAFGHEAAMFQSFIAAMQNHIRTTGMVETLASDAMFENQWYNPMTMIDMPMWMIDGKDLGGIKENQRSLYSQFAGNNIVGRYFGDVQELGWGTRAGVIAFIKNNPNNTAGFFKVMEEKIVPGIQNTRGNEAAHDVELAMITKMLLMMHPELADAFGLKDGIAGIRGGNTAYRQIYGSRVGSLSREDILTLAEGHVIPNLPPKLKRRMRRMLKITDEDRLKRFAGTSLFIFLLSMIFSTSSAVFGAVNPAEQAG